jgi:nucleoside phosphorylase/tetratricopeptide (TPR) repeat protein
VNNEHLLIAPTIGIITALPKEHVAVDILLQNTKDTSIPGHRRNIQYKLGEVPLLHGGSLTVVLALLSQTGTNIAAICATHLLSDFPFIRDIVMVGIAGGIPYPEKPEEHVRLGDIVVSDAYGTVQYDYGKKTISEWIPKPFPRPPSPDLLHAVTLLESAALKGELPWLRYIDQAKGRLNVVRPSAETDVLTSSTDPSKIITHPNDKKRHTDHPRVFRGPVATSNTLLKDPISRDELRDRYLVKAVEMESSGIADATWDDRVGYLVIRGICDYGDANKNDTWQEYAAIVAAAYARALLETIPSSGPNGEFRAGKQGNANPKSLSFPPIWNVPYSPNVYFTGREGILADLHKALTKGKPTAITQPHAVYGLGGIGKTQTALQYAHLHRDDYQAIFWVHADSHASLINDYFNLADLLNLSVAQKQDPDYIVTAVKRWFQAHDRWLLIFDNAEDLEMVSSFFPTGAAGNILLTTRRQATGTIAQQIRVENMSTDEGALFLLRRAKVILLHTPLEQIYQTDLQKAQEISRILSGLPLALDQAGAYIEETKCSLAEYLEIYQKRRADLLTRRGTVSSGHPDSVATTFSLLYERVKKNNNGAIALLKLCAFLQADAIPTEIINIEGAPELASELLSIASDPFERNRAIEELLQHSLLYRDTNANILTIHRLVQAVIKDSMTQDEQQHWGELAVQAVNHAFPPRGDYTTWPTCQRYFPQAQECAELIKRWKLTSVDAFHLLDKTANYAYQRAQYEEAKQLLQQLLAVQGSVEDPEYSYTNTITIHNAIAGIDRIQARYAEAEERYVLTLRMCENIKDSMPPVLASIYSGLGVVYEKQGRHSEAEQLLQEALSINLQHEQETLQVATCQNDLAMVYKKQERFREAETLYLRSLAIREKLLGPHDPFLSEILNNIAVLYRSWGKYPQAEEYYLRSHHIKEQIYEPDHPRMATSYNNLATVYEAQGKYPEACSYYQKAIGICERKLGPDHPNTKSSKTDYENFLKKMNREN